MGPTGLWNTKVLQGIQTVWLCIPTDIELSYRLLLSLHSIIAVSVYPSLINSWIYLSCTWMPNLRFKSWTDSSGEYENMKIFTQNITNTYCDVLQEVQNSNSCSS